MKTILTLDKANQPYGFAQLDGNGNLNATGSLYGTASWAYNASSSISSSYALTASYALNFQNTDLTGYVSYSAFNNWTSSNASQFYGTSSYADNANSSKTAQTASYLNNLTQDLTITGNINVIGTASINYLNVVYETASVIYSSGSNQFGDATNDTQLLFGRVIVSGSLETTGAVYLPNLTGGLEGTASWATNFVSASDYLRIDKTGSMLQPYLLSSQTASMTVATASYYIETDPIFTAKSASFATTGSNTFIGNQIVSGGFTVFTGSSVEFSVTNTGVKIGNTVSDTHQVTGSLNVSGNFYIPRGVLLNSPDNTITNKYAIKVESGSGAIWANNINAGYPSSNNWQSNLQGSYFNNFTVNTDVSEILRFIAGLLSSSAPDVSPNTKTYGGITATQQNTGTSTIAAGTIPSGSTNSTILYLQQKGLANSGSTIFSGLTIQTNYNTGYHYSSSATGTTTVSSSADSQLFGLGTIIDQSTPRQFNASGSFTFKYSNNSSKTITATSSSTGLLSNSTFSTTNGLTVAKIPTVNVAVIPSAYQDGKFAGIFQTFLYSGSEGSGGATGSGYYQISASIAISSGSSQYTPFYTHSAELFWAPVSAINAAIPTNTITIGSPVSTTSGLLTAVSRSLSGAPYLVTASYYISTSFAGIFNPLYTNSSAVALIISTGVAGLTTPSTVLSTVGGTIQTANVVYDSTGTIVRSVGTVPGESDIVKLSTTSSFLPNGITNIGQSTITPTTFTYTLSGAVRTGTTSIVNRTISYHTSGSFGQPISSGSMAYYGRAQGYDGGTYTISGAGSLTTDFSGENNRVQITNKLLSGSYSLADTWNTSSVFYNLSGSDLQIKPGYLVKPGGTYKYWLNDSDASQTAKYCAIGFTRNVATNQPSITMTLAGNTTLVEWTDTSTNNAIAMLLVPQSVLSTVTQASGIDPKASSTTLLSVGNTGNPFSVSLNVLANTNAQKTNPFVIDFPTSPNAFPLNGTYKNFILLVRYIGDPTPLTSITFTITA